MGQPIRILFFGTPLFARTTLEALVRDTRYRVVGVVTQPDKPSGRHRQLTACPVKEFAVSNSIPVLQPTSLRKEIEPFRASVAAWGPIDCGVVVAFGQILPRAVLETPAHGCLNVHASLLPRWRGAAPMQRALMAGDKETGVCLMQMDEGLDTGPVFARSVVSLSAATTLGELHNILAEVGASLLVTELPRIIAKEIEATSQPEQGVSYANKISNEEARIEWQGAATDIHNQIRGLSPYPGAYTFYRGTRLKIYRSSVLSRVDSPSHPPGTVLRADRVLTIQCGRHEISVEELQLEGRKRLSAAEFLRGITLSPGEVLGA